MACLLCVLFRRLRLRPPAEKTPWPGSWILSQICRGGFDGKGSECLVFQWIDLMDSASWMLPCRFQQAFGVACPGCGLQRSVWSLWQGRIGESFLYYPALLPFLCVLLLALVYALRPRRFWRRVLLFFVYLTLFLVLVHWIYLLCWP